MVSDAAAEETEPQNVPTVKAYKNPDFLSSPGARHIRIMCELHEPMKRLTDTNIDNYVLFCGSHLVMHPDERAAQIAELSKQEQAGLPADELEAVQAKLRQAKGVQPMDRYYLVAMDLAGMIARWSSERQQQGLPTYHVCTGGGPGVMEAANRGAHDAGSLTLGFGATRPEWGKMNKYVPQDGAFEFHYFFMRKFWMAYKCMGLVVLPGGYGSLDELFELLALLASRKISHRLPIVLLGKEHWKKVINFDYLVETCMLSRQSAEMMVYMDTAEEAFAYLKDQVEQGDKSGENGAVENAKRRRLCKNTSTGSTKGATEGRQTM